MMKTRATAIALMAAAVTVLSGCGSTVAGTSAVGQVVSAPTTSSQRATPPPRSAGPVTTTAPASTSTATETVTAAAPATVTSTPPPVVVPPPVVTVTRAPSTVYVPQPSSSEADQQVAADSYTAELMVGWWIPQLSSNTDSDSAMTKFRTLQGRGPGYGEIFMVDSADFTSFRNSGYYVILMPEVFLTAGEANAWCDAEGFAIDDCLAKQLSHTDGPDGLTVERG
ncbi:hypothetical protein ACVBEQ_08020 [Nakamurella sp. GG22]